MIKNFNVKIRNLKVARLKTFLNYLNSKTHKNHTKKKTEIFELSNRGDFEKINGMKIVKNKEEYIRNGKGGKPLQVLGKSLTFNIPKGWECSPELAKLIYEDLVTGLIELYQHLPPYAKGEDWTNYELNEAELYSVFHNQDNSHIHLVCPYLARDGKVLRGVKSPTFTNGLKLLWNQIMQKHYGMTIEQYQPLSEEEQEKGKNRRYLELMKYEYEQRLAVKEEQYLRNQMIVIDRELEKNDEDISEDKVDTIEKNYGKARGYYKTLKKVDRPM